MPERDMLSLGVMGMGAGGLGKFFRRRRRRRPPQKGLFGKIQILSILTHSRAMNFLASPYESYGRGGSCFILIKSLEKKT